MNDRELLELAAKAAGIGEVWYLEGSETSYVGPRYEPGKEIAYSTWSPLTDDGDALRLAVKLGIFDTPAFFHFRSLERFGKQEANDYAATRCAIVRAAAAIAEGGKS